MEGYMYMHPTQKITQGQNPAQFYTNAYFQFPEQLNAHIVSRRCKQQLLYEIAFIGHSMLSYCYHFEAFFTDSWYQRDDIDNWYQEHEGVSPL